MLRQRISASIMLMIVYQLSDHLKTNESADSNMPRSSRQTERTQSGIKALRTPGCFTIVCFHTTCRPRPIHINNARTALQDLNIFYGDAIGSKGITMYNAGPMNASSAQPPENRSCPIRSQLLNCIIGQ